MNLLFTFSSLDVLYFKEPREARFVVSINIAESFLFNAMFTSPPEAYLRLGNDGNYHQVQSLQGIILRGNGL